MMHGQKNIKFPTQYTG